MISAYFNEESWNISNFNNIIIDRTEFASGIYQNRFVIIAGGRSKRFMRGRQKIRSKALRQDNEELNSVAIYDLRTLTREDLPDLPFKGECKGTVHDDYFYVEDISTTRIHRICLSECLSWEIFVVGVRSDELWDFVQLRQLMKNYVQFNQLVKCNSLYSICEEIEC